MKKSLILAVASLAVISCSKREMDSLDNDPSVVRFAAVSGGDAASKVTVDANGHSTFETGDIIGIYAVNSGAELGDASGVFPTNASSQFLNKKYKVTKVDPWTSTTSPALATFAANSNADRIYYQTQKKAWHYYAYYPTSDLTEASIFSGMNTNPSVNTFSVTSSDLTFMNQVNVKGNDIASGATAVSYPGPIMFAYYNTADSYTPGTANSPVQLDFKYANAKLTVNIEMEGNTGCTVGDISSIILYGTGMKAGFVFDLVNAKNIYAAPVANNVLTANASGAALDGSGRNGSGEVEGGTTNAYVLGKKVTLAAPVAPADSTLCTTTGYLIPCTGITKAKIEIRVGSGTGEQLFTAELDKSGVPSGTNWLSKIEAGKEYIFNIVVSRKDVNFTGTIEDWVPAFTTTPTIPAE